MTYYSCPDTAIRLCGPRGIRTPDLLNAIETRSQLRYGPGCEIYDFRFTISDCRTGTSIVNRIVNLWT